MFSQIYVEPSDRLLCHHDGGERFSVEVDPVNGGTPFRALISAAQLRVLHRNIGDALARHDPLRQQRPWREVEWPADGRDIMGQTVPAEAVVDVGWLMSQAYDAADAEFAREMAEGFDPAMPPEWAERNSPEGDF